MLQTFFERLMTSGAFADVQVAESIAAISAPATAAADNTVFVAPWRERALAPRNITGGHQQIVEVQILTGLVFRQHGDPRGGARARRFDEAKRVLEGLLAGWCPGEAGFPVALAASEAQGIGNGVSILVNTWQVSRFLTGATP